MAKRKHILWGVVALTIVCVAAMVAADSCRYDIACLQKRDSWLQERLDKRVPLFLVRMSGSEGPATKKITRRLERQTNQFRRFHYQQKQSGPISCAVVGSGSTLSGSGYGDLIDSHNYVFRMNNAPVQGYENDVGKKTTFNVLVNNVQSEIRFYGPDTFAVVWGGADTVNVLSAQIFHTPLNSPEDAKRLVMEAPQAQRILIFSRQFNGYIVKNWFKPEDTITDREWPSTGFRAVLLSLHLCNTVDLFGFGPDDHGRWGHYFKKSGVWTGHLPEYQETLLDELARRRIIHRYMGDMHQP